MKRTFSATVSIVLFLIALLTSCTTNDQKFANKLEGTWQIRKMTYQPDFEKDFELPQVGTISFDACLTDKKGPVTCDGTISLNGTTQNIWYSPPQRGLTRYEIDLMKINTRGDDILVFSGMYEVQIPSKKNLILEGSLFIKKDPNTTATYTRVRIELSK